MTITTEFWLLVRWLWVLSFAGAIITLLAGGLPDREGSPVADGLRWVFCSLLFLTTLLVLGRGLLG